MDTFDVDTGEGISGNSNVASDDSYSIKGSPFDRSGISDLSSFAKDVREAGDAIFPLFTRRSNNFGQTASHHAPVSNGLAAQLGLLGYGPEDIKGLTKGQKERILARQTPRNAIAPRVNAAAAHPLMVGSGGGFQITPTIMIVGLIAAYYFFVK